MLLIVGEGSEQHVPALVEAGDWGGVPRAGDVFSLAGRSWVLTSAHCDH